MLTNVHLTIATLVVAVTTLVMPIAASANPETVVAETVDPSSVDVISTEGSVTALGCTASGFNWYDGSGTDFAAWLQNCSSNRLVKLDWANAHDACLLLPSSGDWRISHRDPNWRWGFRQPYVRGMKFVNEC